MAERPVAQVGRHWPKTAFLAHSDDNNATMRNYFLDAGGALEPTAKVSCPSQRKWSVMTFPKLSTLVVGAPEYMIGTAIPRELCAEFQHGKWVFPSA